MRVTTAFSRLLRLPGCVVQEGSLRARSGRSRGRAAPPAAGLPRVRVLDARSEGQAAGETRSGGILDLGIWRLEVRCRRRRLWCRVHGARTESVPFARAGSEFTRDFECLVAWLATRTDKSTIKRMLRIDWDTVGRIVKRVCDAELDPSRLARSLRHRHRRGQLEDALTSTSHSWSTITAARWCGDARGPAKPPRTRSSRELEPAARRSPRPSMPTQPPELPEPAIMVPFGPMPDSPRRPRHPGRVAGARPGARARRSSRAPDCCAPSRWTWLPATPSRSASTLPKRSCASTPITWCSSPTRRSTKSAAPTGTSCARSATSDAAKRFKDSRWCLLKTTRQAHRRAGHHTHPDQGRRRRGLARLHTQRSRPRHLRTRPLDRRRRGADQAGC